MLSHPREPHSAADYPEHLEYRPYEQPSGLKAARWPSHRRLGGPGEARKLRDMVLLKG